MDLSPASATVSVVLEGFKTMLNFWQRAIYSQEEDFVITFRSQYEWITPTG